MTQSKLTVEVVNGVGEGKTLLSAYDQALVHMGVANYNLIPLSSIIPPQTTVIKKEKYSPPPNEFGYRLYCIKADIRSETPNQAIAAGIGWYQFDDNRGLFVEHELTAETKEEAQEKIQKRITDSLNDLMDFRNVPFDPKKVFASIAVTQVIDKPAAALSVAVFQSQGW
jgi:arginine decarboxylase